MPNPPSVQDSNTANQFVQWCVERLDLAYHPDTSFSEYVDDEGTYVFSEEEAHRLDQLNGQLFKYIDPYEVGLALFRERMGYAADSDQRLLETT